MNVSALNNTTHIATIFFQIIRFNSLTVNILLHSLLLIGNSISAKIRAIKSKTVVNRRSAEHHFLNGILIVAA